MSERPEVPIERAEALARLYALSSRVNGAFVRLGEPSELYEAACRIAVEEGFAALAWVGVYDDEEDRLVPVARFGAGRGYVDAITLRLRDERINRGPAATAMQTGAVAVSNDIANDPSFFWKAEALEHGIRACALFPLRRDEVAMGVVAIYADRVGAFGVEEVRVLGALADNLAFAVESARHEVERRALIEALGERVKELSLLHGAARLLQLDRPVDEALLADLVRLIPPGWRLPSRCEARITWNGLTASTEGWSPSASALRATFGGAGVEGAIEVAYRDSADAEHLPEEYELIRSLADMLGTHFVRALVEARLRADTESRRRLEEQLRQAQKMEAVGQLAGGVAHDFNNLLSVILGYATILAEDLETDHPMRGDLEEIRRAGERAATLTRQLLAFSRKQMMQPRRVDLRELLAGMENMLHRLLGDDVRLSVRSRRGLGEVHADPGQVEQVVMNLAVNARDAMPKGGELTIELENATLDEAYAAAHHGVGPGRYVMIAVADTGEGMDSATCARAFEPFFTTKPQGKGTGLGLATVYGIVKQSGGHVWLYSELGRGTSFKVYLPRTDEPAADAQPESPAPTSSNAEETILLVEDEPQVRELTRAILSRAGYHVLDAENGGEAFLICEQYEGPIHLLLTDVVMPRMSGPEIAARLAPMRPDMAILYMSGYAEGSVVNQGVIDADVNFLSKPITPAVLLRRVAEVLGRHASSAP